MAKDKKNKKNKNENFKDLPASFFLTISIN
jgi:hypothetical protein